LWFGWFGLDRISIPNPTTTILFQFKMFLEEMISGFGDNSRQNLWTKNTEMKEITL
jgi:hypothetical protein